MDGMSGRAAALLRRHTHTTTPVHDAGTGERLSLLILSAPMILGFGAYNPLEYAPGTVLPTTGVNTQGANVSALEQLASFPLPRYQRNGPADVPALLFEYQILARAWWQLAGGSGAPSANCSLVQELLRCLLLPEPCDLARDLGVISPLDSHYTGVFVAGPDHTIVSPTAEFTRRLLRRRILAAGAAGTGRAAGAWSPIVALHDAYSTGIEWHRYRSAWLGFQLPLTPPLPLTRG